MCELEKYIVQNSIVIVCVRLCMVVLDPMSQGRGKGEKVVRPGRIQNIRLLAPICFSGP